MEIWKDIVGFEGFYQVSDSGRVRSLLRTQIHSNGNVRTYESKILKPNDADVYLSVNLYKKGKSKTYRIHRIVAAHFKRRPRSKAKKVVNHKLLKE